MSNEVSETDRKRSSFSYRRRNQLGSLENAKKKRKLNKKRRMKK